MSAELLRQLSDLNRRLERIERIEKGGGSGTAFPSSPPTNLRWFRTDLGWWCYYDGSQWLTEDTWRADLFTGVVVTGAGGNVIGPDWRSDYAPFITRITISNSVATTNNGSNFWTILVRSYNATYGAATGIHQIDTSAQTAGTWYQVDTSSFSGTGTPSNRAHLDTNFSVFGAPGNITATGVIEWRIIVT